MLTVGFHPSANCTNEKGVCTVQFSFHESINIGMVICLSVWAKKVGDPRLLKLFCVFAPTIVWDSDKNTATLEVLSASFSELFVFNCLLFVHSFVTTLFKPFLPLLNQQITLIYLDDLSSNSNIGNQLDINVRPKAILPLLNVSWTRNIAQYCTVSNMCGNYDGTRILNKSLLQ